MPRFLKSADSDFARLTFSRETFTRDCGLFG
jgi:hypothetical protein